MTQQATPPTTVFCQKCREERQIKSPEIVLSKHGYYKSVVGTCSHCGEGLEADALSPWIDELRREGWRKLHEAQAEGAFSSSLPLEDIPGIKELSKSAEFTEAQFEDKPDWDGLISTTWLQLGAILEPIADLKKDITLTRHAGQFFEAAANAAERSLREICEHRTRHKALLHKYSQVWRTKVLPVKGDVKAEDWAPLSDLLVNDAKIRDHLRTIWLASIRAERCFRGVGDADRAETWYVKKMCIETARTKGAKRVFLTMWKWTSMYGTSLKRWGMSVLFTLILYTFLYWRTPTWLPGWFK